MLNPWKIMLHPSRLQILKNRWKKHIFQSFWMVPGAWKLEIWIVEKSIFFNHLKRFSKLKKLRKKIDENSICLIILRVPRSEILKKRWKIDMFWKFPKLEMCKNQKKNTYFLIYISKGSRSSKCWKIVDKHIFSQFFKRLPKLEMSKIVEKW